MEPIIICPSCHDERPISNLLTAQSNQNVIYQCKKCHYEQRNIPTKKG
ncbi:hypothetical protein [Halalkalibacter urbisdiaboli]|nr:hypothetical protein [Halalkalibacter urbisdiaboli]